MSAEWEIQQAIYDALTNDAPLMAEIVGVYDHVPQSIADDPDSAFPYVVIGEDTNIEWDTDTSRGHEATVTLHVWSRHRGRKETKEIQGLIYDVLHRNTGLAVTGYHTVDCFWEYSDTTMDPDGLTRHGVQRFRVTIEKD